jgi:hypothetical protein
MLNTVDGEFTMQSLFPLGMLGNRVRFPNKLCSSTSTIFAFSWSNGVRARLLIFLGLPVQLDIHKKFNVFNIKMLNTGS